MRKTLLTLFAMTLLAGCGSPAALPSSPHAPTTLQARFKATALTLDHRDFRRYHEELDAFITSQAGKPPIPGGWLQIPFEDRLKLKATLNSRYYAPLYQDPALMEQTQDLVTQWANTTSAYQTDKRHAWEWIASGKSPRNDEERRILAIRKSRADRWKRLAQRVGMAPPPAFVLYRGSKSQRLLDSVAIAWKDERMPTVRMPLYTLSSWTMSETMAVEFAGAYGITSRFEKPWVVFEATVPFEQTLLDKWVDGSDFATQFPGQHEVVVATATENALEIPETDVSIRFEGQVYRHADRAAFLAHWDRLRAATSP